MSQRSHVALASLSMLIAFAAPAIANDPLERIGTWPGANCGLALEGNRAYVGMNQTLHVIDISNPASPVDLGGSEPFSENGDVVAQNGVAYVASGISGMRIFSVADPKQIHQIGQFDTAGRIYDVAVSGNVAVLSDHWDGLYFVNVSNPAAPTLFSFFPGFQTMQLLIRDSLLYVTSEGNFLQIIDLSTPAAPTELDLLPTAETYNVAVDGPYAFTVGEGLALQCIDVSNPQSMVSLNYISGSDTYGVAVHDGFAYTSADRIRAYDVAIPKSPNLVLSTAGALGDPEIHQGLLWAINSNGLVAIRPLRRGDLNSDGAINTLDSALLVSVLSGYEVDPLRRALADVDRDGAPTGHDIQPFVARLVE